MEQSGLLVRPPHQLLEAHVILTEKVARRGFHVLREYSVGALGALFVRDLISTSPLSVEPDHPLSQETDIDVAKVAWVEVDRYAFGEDTRVNLRSRWDSCEPAIRRSRVE